MQKYAIIGRAPLVTALGLARNHKESADTASKLVARENQFFLDAVAHTWGENSDKYNEALKACQERLNKVNQKTKYINEKNRYGSKNKLSAASLLLFLYLHFCPSDYDGSMRVVHVPTAARILDCDEKTIHASLKNLSENQYISFTKKYAMRRGTYSVFLQDFSDYHKKAEKGGRGYIRFSERILKQLIAVKKINSLRLMLRVYMDIDEKNRGAFAGLFCVKDMDQLRLFLPAYIKPCDVRRVLSVTQEMYKINIQESCHFELNPDYYAKSEYRILKEENEARLEQIIETLNEHLESRRPENKHMSLHILPANLQRVLINFVKQGLYGVITVMKESFKDIIQMTVEYNFEDVTEMLFTIWQTMPFDPKREYGPIIRNMILGKYTIAF